MASRRPGISPKTTGEYNTSKPSFTPTPVSSPPPGSTPEQRFLTLDAGRDSVPQREGQYVLVIILIPAFIHPTPIYWAPPVDYVLGWASRIYKSIKQSSCPQWAHRQGRAKPWGELIRRQHGEGKVGIMQTPRKWAKRDAKMSECITASQWATQTTFGLNVTGSKDILFWQKCYHIRIDRIRALKLIQFFSKRPFRTKGKIKVKALLSKESNW